MHRPLAARLLQLPLSVTSREEALYGGFRSRRRGESNSSVRQAPHHCGCVALLLLQASAQVGRVSRGGLQSRSSLDARLRSRGAVAELLLRCMDAPQALGEACLRSADGHLAAPPLQTPVFQHFEQAGASSWHCRPVRTVCADAVGL
jgi:hypothetical protein